MVGRRERRQADHVQVVVDLQRVRAQVLAERVELGRSTTLAAEPGDGACPPGSAGVGEDAEPLRPRRREPGALGVSQDCCTTPRFAALTQRCGRTGSGTLHAVDEVTVFELVGGQPFFDALVDRFYDASSTTRVLRPLYPETSRPGKRALALFLGQYWGGPPAYSAEKGHPRLRMRHAPVHDRTRERDAWLAAMLAARRRDRTPPEAAKAAMREYFEMAATAMINTQS